MDVTFLPEEVAKWASFSGDYNDIHFDSRKARLIGASDVVAHGMLVLLPIKQALSHALAARSATDGWFHLKAFFRTPVPCNQQHTLTLTTANDGRVRFRVYCPQSNAERVRGWAAQVEEAPDGMPPAPVGSTYELPVNSLPRFLADFSSVKNPWIWLDALTFATLVRRHLGGATRWSRPETAADSVEAGPPTVVVQTSQEVIVSTRFFAPVSADEAACLLDGLRYTLTLPGIASGDADRDERAQAAVWLNDDLILLSELGILSKPNIARSVHSRLHEGTHS